MLKLILPCAIRVITHIINSCRENSIIPKLWKKSIIIILPKETKIERYGDLCPISILPVLSKVPEKVVYDQFFKCINKNSILPSVQVAFKKGDYTAMALSKLTNDLISSINGDMVTHVCLLDFSMSFDAIHRELLLSKLKF